jgi:hypothetical protein
VEVIGKLLSFVPDALLEQLAISTAVNKFSKKLQGELLFKLLLYCIVTEKDNSLRGMQSALESAVFSAFKTKSTTGKISHSSISERLTNIKSAFFEEIFNACVASYKDSLGSDEEKIIRFDSTIVALSGKLLHTGYRLKGGDAQNYKLLKFTIGFTNIPEAVYFYKDQKHTSENVALSDSILKYGLKSQKINVFDRGITSRDNYDKLTESNIQFISRINNEPKLTEYKSNTISNKIDTPTLKIISDRWVYLYTMRSSRTLHPVRLIRAIKKSDGEHITFLTNIESIKPKDITEIYKSRWDIEIFFKFIKQHLNFSHLLNRSENGIKSVLYVTMTAAILLLHYRKINNLKGFKIVKQKFAQELERNIIYNVVIICDGDPQKAKQLLYPNST